MRREKATLWEWLRLRSILNYSENSLLGSFLGFAILLFVFTLVALSVAVLGMLVVMVVDSGVLPSAERAEAIRNLGLLLAATLGLPFLVWRSFVAQKQVNVAEQGHITDRINEAVQGLGAEKVIKRIRRKLKYKKKNGIWERDKDGNLIPATRPNGEPIEDIETFEETVPNLEVRIGSIYALERIALDSARDHVQIMEILCAYVRENAPLYVSNGQTLDRAKLRVDLQTVVSVIGRRSEKQIASEWDQEYRLDFRNTNLAGGNFSRGDFSAAMFDGCFLNCADFRFSRLIGTSFNDATLISTSFMGGELVGSLFKNATIGLSEDAEPSHEGDPLMLMDLPFALAEMTAVNLMGADLSRVGNVNFSKTFGTRDTILGPVFEERREKVYQLKQELMNLNQAEDKGRGEVLRSEIKKSQFANWSLFDSNHLAVHSQFRDMLELSEISGFPHFNS